MSDERRQPDPLLDSDASGNSAHGLAGDLGISSERTGAIRGSDAPATHGAEATDGPDMVDPPPEQSADPATGPEPHPANDVPPHPFDPKAAQPHSHG